MIAFNKMMKNFINTFYSFDSIFIKYEIIRQNSGEITYIQFEAIKLGSFVLSYADRRTHWRADRRTEYRC